MATLPAHAQDRLFMDGAEIGAHGRFGQTIGPANGLDGTLAGGGRFLVVPAETFGGEINVVDLRTGARRSLPTGAIVYSVDPARPRLILALPATGPTGTPDVAVYDIVTGATDVVVTGACPGLIGSLALAAAYAYDAQLVLVLRCAAPQVVQDLVAVDLSGPSPQVRVLPFTPNFNVLEVSSDGQRLFARSSTGFLTGVIDAYDIASGTKVGSAEVAGETVRWDDGLDALLVVFGGGPLDSRVSVFGRSMEPLGAAVFSSPVCQARVQVSAHTGRIYLTRNGANNTGAAPAVVEAFAGAPLQLVGRANVSPLGQQSCAGAKVRTAPGAPRSLQATVNGRDVTVDWTNVGGASGFLLDIGLAAGRTDLSIALGPNSHAAFANVPPGTYYLRVRGGNEFGGGRPSQEVQVVVP